MRSAQPPAYSPVSMQSLWAGLRSALGANRSAENEVRLRLKEEFGSRLTVLTDTGTSALSLAIRAAADHRPGLVAIPAYSCYDVSSAAEGAGSTVVAYDVDPASLSPDLASLQHAITEGATVLVVAHLFGVPLDIGTIRELAAQHEVILIEDAAQGIGASFAGAPVGSFGDISILSFARGKGITGGGGGALMATSIRGLEICRGITLATASQRAGWRELGRATAVWLLSRPDLYGSVASLSFLRLGETIYRPPVPPLGMARASTGVLSRTYGPSHEEALARQRNADWLVEVCEASPLEPIRPASPARPSYLRFPVLAPTATLGGAKSPAGRHLGIAVGYPKPLPALVSLRARCQNCNGPFPGADYLATHLMTFPTHTRLRETDKRRMRDWIRALG